MSNIFTKNILRQKYKKLRRNITEKKIKSEKIINSFFSSFYLNSFETICVYYSTKEEVNTHDFIINLLKNKKRVFVPFMQNIAIGEINSINNLVIKNVNSNIYYEPEYISQIKIIDLIIIPGIVFDKKGNRIGNGSGWYDKFLPNIICKHKIAFAFHEQIIDEIVEPEYHDKKVDFLITDKNTYNFNNI